MVRDSQLGDAERKVELGVFRRVYDSSTMECVGYQMVNAKPDDGSLPARQSSASITASEVQANAGVVFKDGKSRTERMPEELRLQRVNPTNGRALPAEDFVELAVAKVALWPEIGDTKAARVSPRGSRKQEGPPS